MLFLTAASALVTSDSQVRRPGAQAQRMDRNPATRHDGEAHDSVRSSAAFIANAGYWAHRHTPGCSSWPFPLDADCDALANIGRTRGMLGVGLPAEGDIYLRYSQAEHRFTRACIVLWAIEVPASDGLGVAYDCHVIEGSAELVVGAESVQTNVHWARRCWVTSSPKLGDGFLSWTKFQSTSSRRAA